MITDELVNQLLELTSGEWKRLQDIVKDKRMELDRKERQETYKRIKNNGW